MSNIVGTEFDDVLFGTSEDDWIEGLGGSDRLWGYEGNDLLEGGDGASDFLLGGEGDDVLSGGAGGSAMMDGGEGSDTYRFSSGDGAGNAAAFTLGDNLLLPDLMYFTVLNPNGVIVTRGEYSLFLYVPSTGASLNLYSANPVPGQEAYRATIEFADGTIWGPEELASLPYNGTEGNDVLNGSQFNDDLRGLGGNDYLFGNDGKDYLDGGDGMDRIYGGAGNDFFVDSTGSDQLYGGAGDDTYLISDSFATIYENAGEGTDVVLANVNYVLSDNVETLIMAGSQLFGTGNDLNNVISGNDAMNVIDGRGGVDIMMGGLGDDWYYVDQVGDVVIENNGSDNDLVRSSAASYTLAANVESLFLEEGAVSGIGNAANNAIHGNDAANVLNGGAGNDSLVGNGGADVLSGGTGDDSYFVDASDTVVENAGEGFDTVNADVNFTLSANVENLSLYGTGAIDGTGNALNNRITGNDSNNVLDGGAGLDVMFGNAGDDTYIVDNGGDAPVERNDEGVDTVLSSVGWTLGANFERLILTGTANLIGAGNELDNYLEGNEGNDLLNAAAGDDVLDGRDGADRLFGGTGNDTLIGGTGDDTYWVGLGDVVIENALEGNDQVLSGITYTLGAEVEKLALTGDAPINGTGNTVENSIWGNLGDNVIDGGVAADFMYGNDGNDTFMVDNAGDVTLELTDHGMDTVRALLSWTLAANVENLVLIGTDAIDGTGNALDNTLTGNSADNILSGGAGNDTYFIQNAGDSVYEETNGGGTDTVNSSVTYTLGANIEALFLTGDAHIDATGNASANLIRGNAGSNHLDGGGGFDALEGGDTSDALLDTAGGNYFNGGTGSDSFLGSAVGDFFIGGTGNDLFFFAGGGGGGGNNTGGSGGADVFAFNVGDGWDIINPSSGADDTLSLGGAGLDYASLTFQKVGKDLVLNVNATDKVQFMDWYLGQGNKSMLNLQVVAEAMAAFDRDSGNPLLNREVQSFDFRGLVGAFDDARKGNPGLTTWALSNALTQYHVSGADDLALGGDLAYLYGLNGTLAGMSFQGAQSIVTSSQFGVQAQGHLIGDPSADPLKLS